MRSSWRMMEGVAKLCQRRLYSWLSSRCGLPVCIVGTILLVVSVLQFGEVRELCGPSCPSSPDTALLRCCSPGAKKSMSTSSVSTLTTSLASRLRDSEWLFPPPTSCSRARLLPLFTNNCVAEWSLQLLSLPPLSSAACVPSCLLMWCTRG